MEIEGNGLGTWTEGRGLRILVDRYRATKRFFCHFFLALTSGLAPDIPHEPLRQLFHPEGRHPDFRQG